MKIRPPISAVRKIARGMTRVIPRAIFLTALIGGLIFIFATYFLQLYFPDISRFKDPDASQPEIMLYVAGKAFQVGDGGEDQRANLEGFTCHVEHNFRL